MKRQIDRDNALMLDFTLRDYITALKESDRGALFMLYAQFNRGNPHICTEVACGNSNMMRYMLSHTGMDDRTVGDAIIAAAYDILGARLQGRGKTETATENEKEK